ncbi:hypothetical protein ZYGR_0N04170 [Zygosaccharomyces rouxii]|uniref:ZYRO0D09878p n=2 Tax=Zygosaccharomyces rouxii TaxID=4956 RepID=C5DVW1_ZYGRC|nr:uncharacterized protein ZYRO0D09878g [Zygosaccharomyces rouxii]KAH9200840.1 ubiquitin-conjugating enzyme E2 [Zygosaccharomyces rouxii]GAV49012.1 hypothetical protein ZYGR_0N04170 [Zygosaccharomyces rouxii]CAR27930.1 ZYRO0D09878p [Zygosaccharomyces rouxii]
MSRAAKEYKTITKVLKEGDEVYSQLIVGMEPKEDLTRWEALIRGPSGTPYEGCNFRLHLSLPQEYPMSPPYVKFEPYAMPHANVDFRTGEICLDILTKQHWSPAWDLLHVVQAIGQLLDEPVSSSPLNVDIANILKANDMNAYYGLVHYYIKS